MDCITVGTLPTLQLFEASPIAVPTSVSSEWMGVNAPAMVTAMRKATNMRPYLNSAANWNTTHAHFGTQESAAFLTVIPEFSKLWSFPRRMSQLTM